MAFHVWSLPAVKLLVDIIDTVHKKAEADGERERSGALSTSGYLSQHPATQGRDCTSSPGSQRCQARFRGRPLETPRGS
jgi:hypothetical protein